MKPYATRSRSSSYSDVEALVHTPDTTTEGTRTPVAADTTTFDTGPGGSGFETFPSQSDTIELTDSKTTAKTNPQPSQDEAVEVEDYDDDDGGGDDDDYSQVQSAPASRLSYTTKNSTDDNELLFTPSLLEADKRLNRLNVFMMVCYFVSALVACILYGVLDTARGYTFSIIISESFFDKERTTYLSSRVHSIDVNLTHIIIALFSFNFFCHLYQYVSKRGVFAAIHERRVSYIKWLQWSASSGCLIMISSLLLGVQDLGSLVSLGGCNIAVGYFLLVHEMTNRSDDRPTSYAPYILALILCLLAWSPAIISGHVNGGWNNVNDLTVYSAWMYAFVIGCVYYYFFTLCGELFHACGCVCGTYGALQRYDMILGAVFKLGLGWLVFVQTML
jgi:hypothetical protein